MRTPNQKEEQLQMMKVLVRMKIIWLKWSSHSNHSSIWMTQRLLQRNIRNGILTESIAHASSMPPKDNLHPQLQSKNKMTSFRIMMTLNPNQN